MFQNTNKIMLHRKGIWDTAGMFFCEAYQAPVPQSHPHGHLGVPFTHLKAAMGQHGMRCQSMPERKITCRLQKKLLYQIRQQKTVKKSQGFALRDLLVGFQQDPGWFQLEPAGPAGSLTKKPLESIAVSSNLGGMD